MQYGIPEVSDTIDLSLHGTLDLRDIRAMTMWMLAKKGSNMSSQGLEPYCGLSPRAKKGYIQWILHESKPGGATPKA